MTAFGSSKPHRQTLLAVLWRFGLACLLAALLFVPYTLMTLFLGGLPAYAIAGIGSPGGNREVDYGMAPWGAVLAAAGCALLMAGRLFRDRQLVGRWKAALLLILILLLLSAFVLWQAPLVPEPTISFYYFSANLILLMSIYPTFFGALAGAFLCERRKRAGTPQKPGWMFILFSLPAALAGFAFCWLAINSGLASYARYWEGYQPPYSPFIAAWFMVPILLGVSLAGGFLGASLYCWFQRAFRRPEEPASLEAQEAASTGLVEPAPPSASAARATWIGIGWGYLWRLGLAGLVSLLVTGLLLHTHVSLYLPRILFLPADAFSHPLLELDIGFSPGDWLLPPFFASLFSRVPFLDRFPFFSLTFLPFLLPVPGVLVERALWTKRALFAGLGVVLVLLGSAVGVKNLLLALLAYLNMLWPFGIGSALLTCGAFLCETTTLALLAALALGAVHTPLGKWKQRLLWLLIGAASFVGSLLPLQTTLQRVVYYAGSTPPFRFLSLDMPTIDSILIAGFLLSLPAAFLGGWLRTRLTRRLLSAQA